MERMKDMKKTEKKEKVKNKIDKGQVFARIMAGFLLIAMVLASCSTLIYYLVTK